MLDEPTNHLDIPSKETLEEAVRAFQGETERLGGRGSAESSLFAVASVSAVEHLTYPLPHPPTDPPRSPTHPGSVIAVSHDRYFLRRIATRIITVEDGKLVDYQGDYEVCGGDFAVPLLVPVVFIVRLWVKPRVCFQQWCLDGCPGGLMEATTC